MSISKKNKRIIPLLAIWGIITVCAGINIYCDIGSPTINVFGAYASALVITIVTYKFPHSFFIALLIFDIFAAAFGSVLNLYRTIDCYDRIVHFMSGLIAADAGRLIIGYCFDKYKAARLHIVMVLFSMFFAFACAGLWEVYEFTADQLIGTDMQGNNLNTMGDIVSGVLGGLVYSISLGIYYKKKKVLLH